jgi:hypothetical protein
MREPTFRQLAASTVRGFALRGRTLVATLIVDMATVAHAAGANSAAAELINAACRVAPSRPRR